MTGVQTCALPILNNTSGGTGYIGYSGYSFYSGGQSSSGSYTGGFGYGPFTGAHDALITNSANIVFGDIVVDLSVVAKATVSDAITIVGLSTANNQKAAVGVISGIASNTHVPTSLAFYVDANVAANTASYEIINPIYANVVSENQMIIINAVGEGLINVCGLGGNIEIGDFITTSTMPGKGMLQSDDLLHNYTVAKAREAVTFNSPTDTAQIACIYHCG